MRGEKEGKREREREKSVHKQVNKSFTFSQVLVKKKKRKFS